MIRLDQDCLFEMRFFEEGFLQIGVNENGSFEMRVPEVGPFEVRFEEGGFFEMCLGEAGPFEMRFEEVGSFEMRPVEKRIPQNSASKIETPIIGAFAFAAPLIAPLDNCQNGVDIRQRPFSLLVFTLDGLRPKLFAAPVRLAGILPKEVGTHCHALPERLRRTLGF